MQTFKNISVYLWVLLGHFMFPIPFQYSKLRGLDFSTWRWFRIWIPAGDDPGCLGPCALTPPLCPLTLAGPLAHGHYNCKHQCMRLYLFLWVCAYNMALCACQWVCLCVARVCVSKFVCCCFSFCSLHLKKTPC